MKKILFSVLLMVMLASTVLAHPSTTVIRGHDGDSTVAVFNGNTVVDPKVSVVVSMRNSGHSISTIPGRLGSVDLRLTQPLGRRSLQLLRESLRITQISRQGTMLFIDARNSRTTARIAYNEFTGLMDVSGVGTSPFIMTNLETGPTIRSTANRFSCSGLRMRRGMC